jgi:uncharacterized damage-inducible protein DinB
MNADAFRRLYEYHFAMNRRLWHHLSELSDEDFDRPSDYSQGSVRAQVWHLMTVDEGWFTQLRSDAWPDYLMPDAPQPVWSRDQIRERWDDVERRQRDFLAGITDAELFEHPWAEGEDKDLVLWEVLFHVVNHGTDHRAQTQRQLSDLGVETYPIDYVFFAYDHPLP